MTSIREQILQALVDALVAITPASGYDHDFSGAEKVERFLQAGQTLENAPKLVVLLDDETKDQGENAIVHCDMTVLVEIVYCDDESVDSSTATLVDAVVTDVERAVAAVCESGFGGLAASARIAGVTPAAVVEGQPFFGATVTIFVEYRHDLLDPRAVR